MSNAYVFLGPTLSVASARAELDAVYLPPVAAGDIFRLDGKLPRVVGIIDGRFEHAPSVWHKEIMWIMAQGVHVFGSASLGALRAAELDSFGMRGVGRVYQAVKDGILDRDDEVAVAWEEGPDGYRAVSDAMVSIRVTLEAANDAEIISDAARDVLIAAGTTLFYRDRTWPALLDAGKVAGVDPAELAALNRWLPSGRVDQQADDALAMLRQLRDFLAAGPDPLRVPWTLANTTRWLAAKEHADARHAPGLASIVREHDG
jgi:hypothetical protein